MAQTTEGQQLRATLDEQHPEYEKRVNKWRLIADLWDGTGGVAAPYDSILSDDQMGERARPLPDWKGISFLDRYPREGLVHFLARIRASHYENHLRDIGETILGYIERKPPQINGLPDWLTEWAKKAGYRGRPLAAVRRSIRMNMLKFGWCPVLTDRPKAQDGADARTYVVPYSPRSLTGWDLAADGWAWVMLKDEFVRWPDPSKPPECVERWVRWTRKDWTRWEAVNGGDPSQVASDLHQLDRVPLTLFLFSEPETDACPIPEPPLLGVTETGRRRYNAQSELTDILRGFGAPIFCYPTAKGGTIRGLKAGTDAAIPCSESGNMPTLLTIDPAVIRESIGHIDSLTAAEYRQARADFGVGETAQGESGYARAQRFARNNTQYVQFGQNEAEGLRDVFDCVVRWEGRVPKAELAGLQLVTETDYDLRDLDRELDQAGKAKLIGIGAIAMVKLKKQIRDALVQFEDEKEKQASDAEIEAEAAAEAGMVPPEGQARVPFNGGSGAAPASPDDAGQSKQDETQQAATE